MPRPELDRDIPSDIAALADSIGKDPVDWFHQCHSASLALVKAGVYGENARVARGSCIGVGGQHSWIVIPPEGDDWKRSEEGGLVYHPKATIIDPTLWSYDKTVTGLWTGANLDRHRPHGYGDIWDYGRPTTAAESREQVIILKGFDDLSSSAQLFLEMCEPLGRRGWSDLANGPMQGWPSSEIIAAMDDTPEVNVLVPVDILGHVTDRNPEGLYF
jgi:hypothetical protein